MKTNTFIPSFLVEVVSLIYYKGGNKELHILHSPYAAVGSSRNRLVHLKRRVYPEMVVGDEWLNSLSISDPLEHWK